MKFGFLTFWLFLLGPASFAAALEIIPIEQERFVERKGTVDNVYFEDLVEAEDFGPFVVPGQESSIGSEVVQVTLRANGSAEDSVTSSSQRSVFALVFDLEEKAAFTILGEIRNRTNVGAGADGGGAAILSSLDSGEFLSFHTAEGDSGYSYLPVNDSGVLEVGRYRIWAKAIGEGIDHSFHGLSAGGGLVTFEFSITPVPEPSRELMTAVALLLLAYRQSRVTRAAWS
jgi:hypothetical protein